MAPGGKLASGLALVAGLSHTARAADGDALARLTEMPSCGLECFTSLIQETSCDLGDLDCICSDKDFYSKAQECVLAGCEMGEALDVSRIEADVCERPVRSRKGDLALPLAIEAPAWFCPWIRMYSRWETAGKWELDDWIMLVVGLLYTVFLFVGQITGQQAFGVDIWTLATEDIMQALKQFYIDESFYVVCLGLSKISVLCLYLRIFPGKRSRIAIYITMALVIVPTTILVFLQIFQCRPISYVWEGRLEPDYKDRCMDVNILAFTAAGASIVQDLVILAVPLPLIYKLQMDFKAKTGIVFMFSLGIFITFTSCFRLRYIVIFGRSINPTWDYCEVLIWTGLELAVAVIVACLPSIWVLLKKTLPRVFGSMRSNYAMSNDQSRSRGRLRKKSGPHADPFPDGASQESQIPLDLELGDRIRGSVRTNVYHHKRTIWSGPEKGQKGASFSTVTTVATPSDPKW